MSMQTVSTHGFKVLLRSNIRAMFKDLDSYRGQWTLINSEMGTGKTTLMAQELARSNLRFLWISASHRNLKELESVIRKASDLSAEEWERDFCHLTGIQAFVEADKANCIKPKTVLDNLGVLGWDVKRAVCRACKRFKAKECGYWNDRRRLGETRMVIAPYAYLHVKGILKNTLEDRDVVVFDEDFADGFFRKVEIKVSVLDMLRERFKIISDHEHSENDGGSGYADEMYQSLRDLKDIYLRILEKRKEANTKCSQELMDRSFSPIRISFPKPTDWKEFRTFFEPIITHRSTYYRLYYASRHNVEVGVNTDFSFFFYYLAPLLSPKPAYIALDFTADVRRLNMVLQRAKCITGSPEYPVEVTEWGEDLRIDWVESTESEIIQIGDASNAKYSIQNRPRAIRNVLLSIAKRHPRANICVISYKGFEEVLKIEEIFGPGTQYAYFHNLRGMNEIENSSVLIIVGTPILNPLHLWQRTRDYFGDPSIPNAIGRKLRERLDNQSYYVTQMREVYTVNEMVQAVGRSRYVRKKRTIYVLSGEELGRHLAPVKEISEDAFLAETKGIPLTNRQEHLLKVAKVLLRNRKDFTVQELADNADMSYEATRKHIPALMGLMELSCTEKQGDKGKVVHVYHR